MLHPDVAVASSPHFDLDVTPIARDGARAAIARAYRMEEPAVVQALLPEARLAPDALAATQALGRRLAQSVRAERARAAGVDALMREFSLGTDEGVALMCLAEALLRIPDAATRDHLIRDKLRRGEWGSHVGASPSLFVNAAAWGLLITGRIMEAQSDSRLEQALTAFARKSGEPVIRRGIDLAMRLLGRQFVAGRTIEDALALARDREARGFTYSYDMLGEAAVTMEDAERYFAAYESALHAIGGASAGRGVDAGPGMSVKLSALHPRFTPTQRARLRHELVPRVLALAALARRYDVGLTIDAEESDRLELTLDVIAAVATAPGLAGWQGLGCVVQAYQKRARLTVDWVVELARASGRRLNVRLVKGAYWDSEIKRAQVEGLVDYPVFTRKTHTDVAYLACARALLAAPDAVYPQFATHNAFTIAAVHTLAGANAYEFQCLHGMGETIYDQVVGRGKLDRSCRIYAPVGSHDTLLGYLVRRLLENGANTSFVNRIVDPRVHLDELVADPVPLAERTGGAPHPGIPRPRAILGERCNSIGFDFSDDLARAELAAALAATPPCFEATAVLADARVDGRRAAEQRLVESRQVVEIRNPADRTDRVGVVAEATTEDAARAVALAHERGPAWSALAAGARAEVLERAADRLEADRAVLLALLVREAGRTLPDAVAEVREAVDFCRYYAAEARRDLEPGDAAARGPIVAISPWNFPLSIFVGQVSAALAAGNPVLAKPAEQTPLVAAAAVAMLHAAGVPAGALQLLPGRGEVVGAALVAHPGIAGVLFTGSTSVAQAIHRVLAQRVDDPVLIAETGGQNAMIVDSSALPEQVVADALVSAFDSAGQRCSALRVLCVQEDVADTVLERLRGAMRELAVGDPRSLATDVGPVIDAGARERLEAHVARLAGLGLPIFTAGRGVVPDPSRATFVPPTLIDLGGVDGLRHLTDEVFGPVLHVVRWRRPELEALVQAINATGFALTHGIHTRIDETVTFLVDRIRAGNVYVNRNMIGAVVGVQPFGGFGLSGTGPKAGGPLYLRRLTRNQSPVRFPPDMRELLPGPTGERNELQFRPRGLVACLADDERALRAQARAAQAVGNTAVLLRSHLTIGMRHGLDASRLQLVDTIDFGAVDAVLADLPVPRLLAMRAQVAAAAGRIIPVITPGPQGTYDSARLVVERTLTVNTAAAGGNADLLAMASAA